MAGGTKIGTMFAEINLDSSKYDAGLLKALDNSKDTTTNVEKAWRTMGTRSAEAVDKMKANVINSYEAVKNSATSTAADIERAEIQAKAKLTQINERYYRAQISHVRELEEETRRSNEAVSAGFTKAGKAVLAFGTAVAAASLVVAKSVVEQGMAFETTMKTVQAISSGSAKSVEELADNLERLTEAARKSGANTEWSAQQAGDALKFMAMTGMSVSEQIKGLPGLLDLATAAQMDLAMAADIVTDSLTAFGMATSEIGRFNDALINTTTRANTTVEMLGESLKYVAPVAANMGYSIEQTAGLLGVLANSGIKAEQAGTSLRQSLIRTAAAAKSLGMDVNSSLIDVLEEMHKRQFSVNEVVEEFGLIASTGAVIIMNNVDTYRELTSQIENNEGATQSLATMIRDTLKVDFDLLKSSVSDVALELYELYGEKLKNMVSGMSGFVRENKDEFIAIGQAIGGIIELAIKSAGVIAKLTKEATFGRETPTYNSNAAFDVTGQGDSSAESYNKLISYLESAETALADYSEKLATAKARFIEALSDPSSSDQLISDYEKQIASLEQSIAETNAIIEGIEIKISLTPDAIKKDVIEIEKTIDEYTDRWATDESISIAVAKKTKADTDSLKKIELAAEAAAKKMEALGEAWKKGIRTEEYYDSQVKALKDAKEEMIKNTGDELVAHAVYLVDRAKLDAEYYGTAKSSLKTHVSESQKIQDKFAEDYLKSVTTGTQYQKIQLEKQYIEYKNAKVDQNQLDIWYFSELRNLREKSDKDLESRSKATEDAFAAGIDARFGAQVEAYEELTEAEKDFQEEQKELREDAYKDFSNTIQENTADILRDWDNAWETMTDIMKDALIEMAAEALTTNIIVPIAMEFGSAMGLSWNGVSFSDMTGTTGSSGFGTSLPSSTSINWVQSNVPGMGWLGSTVPGTANTSMIGAGASQGMVTPGSVTGTAASQGFGGMSYGTMAGYGAAGSLGYTYIGDAVGLPQGEYSGATAGVGAMGGAAMGASYGTYGGPIGAVIGAVIGGVLGSFMGPGESDPDLTIKSGSIGSFDGSNLFNYMVDPDDIDGRGNDRILAEASIAYYDEYFTNLDESMSSIDLKNILQNNSFKSTEDFEDFEGDFEGMLSEITDGIFEDLREPLVNALGLSADTFDLSFFEGIQEVNGGSLMDVFADFESVFTTFSDFENRINEQMNDGLSLEQAYGNLQLISGMLDMASTSIDSMASSSTITVLEEIVSVYDVYMQSMEDAMATQEEITQIQSALYQEIGSSVTGLTADSFQNAMIEASQSGGSVTESIKNMLNTSMAQAVAGAASESIFEAFLAPINEQIGAIVAGSIVDGVLTDSATMIESIGTIIDAVDWNGIEDAVSGAMDVLDGLSDVDITTTAAESNIGTTDLTPYGGWVSTVNAAGDGVTWAWAEDSRPESSDVESSDSIAEDQAQLNIELMYLQGDAAAALAMERQLELDAMDESLHATQKSIWALEDLADAENLNIELMYLQGDVSGAVAASRQLELDAMDESLWSAQGLIWALEDLADAENLNIELLEAQGESEKALAASRQLQLDVMDESLWATQQQIWAIEDEETARSEAVNQANMLISLLEAQGETESALTLSRQLELGAMNDAERAIQILIWSLEDAAESAQSVSDAEYDVSIARQDYITALQAEQNALQGIYDAAKTAYTDGIQRAIDAASEAQEGLQDVFDTARDAYIEGLQAEIDAQYELADVAQDAVDSFSDLADSIAEAKGQATDDMALLPDEQYALSRAKLQDAVDLTSSSDPEKVKEGLGLIPGLTSEFLSSSLAGNTDISAYQADYAYVMQLLNSSENIALSQIQTSQDALDEAENQVDELKDILDFVENGAEDTRSLLELQTEYNAANREHDIGWYGDEITRLEGILDFVENGAEDTRSLFELETDYNAAKTALDNSWYDDQITALGLIDGSVLSLEEAEEGYFAALTTAVNLGSTASSTELGLILDAINALNISSNITTINTTNDNSTDIEDSGSHDVYTYGSGDGVSFISLDGNAYTADAVTDFLLGSTASTIDAVMAEYGIDWSTLAGLVNSSRDADTTFTGDDVQTYVQDTNGVSLDGIMYSPDAVLDFITNAPYSDVMDVMSTYGISYDDIANATNRTGPGYSYTGADVEEYLSTRGFADGGTVFSPMMALVGEGGEAEHITPDSQMKGVKDQLKEIKEVLIMMMNTNGNQSKYAQKMWRILDDSQRGERPLTTEVAA